MIELIFNWHVLLWGGLIGLIIFLIGIIAARSSEGFDGIGIVFFFFAAAILDWIGTIVYAFLQPHITWH